MRCDLWEMTARGDSDVVGDDARPEWQRVINGMSDDQKTAFICYACGYLPAATYTHILAYAVSKPRELV